MQAHRLEAVVREDGSLLVTGSPFQPGDRVEVIVLGTPTTAEPASKYPLLGKPYRFDRPTDPAADENEWEACR
jgi:hypothetical protein